MLGLSLSLSGVAVRGSGSSIEQITSAGGTVKDGEQFAVYYAAGGFTGATSVTIGGVACTGVTVANDYNLTAVAPTDNLLHNTAYDMVIS